MTDTFVQNIKTRELIKMLELEQYKVEIDSLGTAIDEMGASL